MSKNQEFQVNESVIYPSHGVGTITAIENQTIGGIDIKVYVISFPQDKMILRVPVSRATLAGLRAPVSRNEVSNIFSVLQSKPKQGNRMWSRRAQEYEMKINSGDIVAVAEVVRDLYKNADCDRSYSERTIYESALNRLAGEIAILETINHEEAVNKLLEVLKEKSAA